MKTVQDGLSVKKYTAIMKQKAFRKSKLKNTK